MRVFLVGGIVRDVAMNHILGTNIQSKDRDWLVVGATPEEMIDQGFKQVGAFPVFIHPETGDEYALARTERKSGVGYKGFSVDFSPDITVEEDLFRRDLTINAMAKNPETGEVIDPTGGMEDIRNKVLRHCSPSFVEDPLRVLRVARFAARFSDFVVAHETMSEMQRIVEAGEIDHLTTERVWKEIEKAFSEDRPSRFIGALRRCGALNVLLPEVDALFGVPQPEKHHPEICTGIHTLMAIDQAAKIGGFPEVWAVLLHDIGKGKTELKMLPQHIGHEKRGADMVKAVCCRLKVPNKHTKLAELVAEFHTKVHRAMELSPGGALKLLEAVGAFRQPDQLESFLRACEADAKGRKGMELNPYAQAERIRVAFEAAKPVQGKMFLDMGHKPGSNIGAMVTQERVRCITDAWLAQAI